MTAPADTRLDEVRRVAARWRAELRDRSEAHRSSDALTELAWADRALADIEAVAAGEPAPAATNGPLTEPTLELF